jgi:hypothetical protein
MSVDYHGVAGDYQYRALYSGRSMQRFWHQGKLHLIDLLIRPHMKTGSRLLEIGCGSGNLLLQATVSDSYPVAPDVAMASLKFVRSRLRDASGPDAPRGFGCIQAFPKRIHADAMQLAQVGLVRLIGFGFLVGGVLAGKDTAPIFIESGRFHGGRIAKVLMERSTLSTPSVRRTS